MKNILEILHLNGNPLESLPAAIANLNLKEFHISKAQQHLVPETLTVARDNALAKPG